MSAVCTHVLQKVDLVSDMVFSKHPEPLRTNDPDDQYHDDRADSQQKTCQHEARKTRAQNGQNRRCAEQNAKQKKE